MKNIQQENSLGPKKTFLVIGIVVLCIAALWPRIFYPMLMNSNVIGKDHRSGGLKQERPAPLRPDLMHPSMRERGRAIPENERPVLPNRAPTMMPGRPSIPGMPGPGMRAAAMKANSKSETGGGSFLMPIYTFVILFFFVYTIAKLFLKNSNKNKPAIQPDSVFNQKVFEQSKVEDDFLANQKLVYTAIQGIIDATTEQLKEIEAKQSLEKKAKENGHVNQDAKDCLACNGIDRIPKRDDASDVDLLLKSIKECCNIKSVSNEKDSDLKSIYLDGELPHDSKILVSGSETTTEKITHEEDDSVDDEAIVLSGKMTISLISLNYTDDDKNAVVDKVNPSPTPAAN